MKIIFLFSIFLFSFGAFSGNKKIKTGYWHTELKLTDNDILPVSFKVQKENKNWEIILINANEKIPLNNIVLMGDSIIVGFPAFDSQLKGKIVKKNRIEGFWYNYAKGLDYKIPFTSVNEKLPRFPLMGSDIDVFGKWEVTFDYDSEPEKALGVFKKMGTQANTSNELVKGTFLTETGDYRFLEGVISSDSLYLSTFDGSHAFLFKSQLKNDTLWGEFLSGNHYKTVWYAVRNEKFELTNPDSLTYVVTDEPISFSLPDLNNDMYTYPNESTEDKVTLIQITGTWCPNCLDENLYLKDQKTKFGNDLEIIAVTFEMPETIEGKIATVQRYKQNLDLDYTFLIGGSACKSCAADLFPMLNGIMSFPTLIFIDKKGMIRRIHTGFSGPGTGEYYDAFVKETNKLLDTMIKE